MKRSDPTPTLPLSGEGVRVSRDSSTSPCEGGGGGARPREGVAFLQPSLHGNTISLLPLAESDFDSLYSAASDPLIWANHPSPNRYKHEDFCQWFESAIQSKSTLVVREQATGKVIGSSRYYEYDEDLAEVSIGYTFLIRSHWGGVTNSELKNLMLKYAFQKVETVWFHVDVRNIRSQKAMEKIGAVLSHTAEKSLLGRIEKYQFYKIERKYFVTSSL